MKKITLVLLIALCSRVFAQSGAGYFVSADGNDANDGLSESAPLKTLDEAIYRTSLTEIKKITVTGALTVENSDLKQGGEFVFLLLGFSGNDELLVTGRPAAAGAERAVLSGRDSLMPVVLAASGNIRFEHIEISGGEGAIGIGLYIDNGATVTLGPGAVVRGNQSIGVFIGEGTCVIEGGEVRDNMNIGVAVDSFGVLTMLSGSVKDNRSQSAGGGVLIAERGRFNMVGGTITDNSAVQWGGGVEVRAGGSFNQVGGTISGNDAPQFPDVARSKRSLGLDLSRQ